MMHVNKGSSARNSAQIWLLQSFFERKRLCTSNADGKQKGVYAGLLGMESGALLQDASCETWDYGAMCFD